MSKAARAVEIYQEEAKLGGESLRKRCIARFKSELAMKDAGAGTYFQNTKKKVEGAGATPQLQLSPNPKPKATEQPKPIPGMVEKAVGFATRLMLMAQLTSLNTMPLAMSSLKRWASSAA